MIEIIPAIDLLGGKCVRLTQGDFERTKIYSDDPVATAKEFEASGLKRLHIVDLDGAKSGRPVNTIVLAAIARETNLEIDFGGGIRTTDDFRLVIDSGAKIVNIGSTAVKEPDLFFGWLEEFGSESILLGADTNAGKIAINGWRTKTEVALIPFLDTYFKRGGQQAFVTDISKDGALEGPATELYAEIRAFLPDLRIIASGGVSSLSDIDDLEKIGCYGVIIGKAIYEGRISLADLTKYQCSQNV
ncbi:MAG: 1-(5-phosphoribosyl)-5-[(5-phosphoribosylamino)methylideneamino]imidazole-4-carboxamide isomerase [Saprospiraceae bacterium]|nr:1-(5-phosphoribosyl)-5-[(5-phosphoribosylamino)methylideneamino]imidazole-4-carboxamide isomerase [Pyrinomonadaceae bacterium]